MAIALRTNFDIRQVIGDLDIVGGSSFPALTQPTCEQLVAEAMTYQFTPRQRKFEKSKVFQEVSGFDDFPSTSLFFAIRDCWQRILAEKFSDPLIQSPVFCTPLQFNELSLQRYEVGSWGITPHLDPASCINLICLFTLVGNCRFAICTDRDSHRYKDRVDRCSIELDARPGNVILLRAPGYRGSLFRPLHMVTDIKGPRISFGLRQRITSPSHPSTTPTREQP